MQFILNRCSQNGRRASLAARNLSSIDERVPLLITIRSFVKCGIAVPTTGARYNEINISINWSPSDNEELILFYDESDEE